jgi:hypothetical protein
MEIVGAISLSILTTKSERFYQRFNKENEKEKFLSNLSSYDVGDVVNFYRDIGQKNNKYLYRLFGYPPPVFRSNEANLIFEESCKNLSLILNDIGNHYRKYIKIYNAYKHGYRIILPESVNNRYEFIVTGEHHEIFQCYFENEDVISLKQLATNCRQIVELIHENNRKSMYIEPGKKVKLELKTLVKEKFKAEDKDLLDKINNIQVFYPTTDDEKKSIVEQQNTILKNMPDVLKYLHKIILIDLDEGKLIGSAETWKDIFSLLKSIGSLNRMVTLKITSKKLKELELLEN